MANWLTRILQTDKGAKPGAPQRLPAKVNPNPLVGRAYPPTEPARLPNASVIYGIAASILFVFVLLYFFRGMWFTAFLLLLPAVCFLGFALHFLKNPNA